MRKGKCDHVVLVNKNGDMKEFGSLPHERLDVNICSGFFTVGRGKDCFFKDNIFDYEKITLHLGSSDIIIVAKNHCDIS